MNVVPKRRMSVEDVAHDGPNTGEPKSILWHQNASGLSIECEAISPPSAVGKTVWVQIRGDEVEHFLKELRDVAIARRNIPLYEAAGGGSHEEG